MNKIWFVSAALVAALATGSAFAADLPPAPQVYAPPPALAPPIYSWTGCYLGIEGGGAWGRSQQTAATAPAPADVGLPITSPFNMSGALFGGTAGCNYQFGSVVFGVENDFSWTNKSGSSPDIPPFAAGSVSSTKEDWLDTLRGRVGFAWDRFMVYGTGGAAFADVGVNVCSVAAICVSDSQERTGWTAGVGGEWAAWTSPGGSLTFKLEYLHVDFGTGLFISPPVTIAGVGTYDSRNVRLTDDIVRGGVNWKFNGW
jgi:outer membrane immunogenic protein